MVKGCTVKGCKREMRAKGLCHPHYMRAYRGRPDARLVGVRSSAAARFAAKVDRSAGPGKCHPWTGSLTPEGYGRVRVGQKVTLAHRQAYALASGGKIKRGKRVIPCPLSPACQNVKHLRLG